MRNRGYAVSYAHILYDVCSESNNLETILYDSNTLLQIHDREIRQVLSVPIISKLRKKEIVDVLIESDYSIEIVNLIKILIDNNEIHLFNAIIKSFQKLYQEKNDILVVNVTLAKPATSSQLDKIRLGMEARTNKFVVVLTKIDPSIIGGIKISFDSKVIDNSISSYLKNIQNIEVK